MAVAIAFAVRLVVLVVVADEIAEREAVMGGDEIDARPGPPAVVAEDVGRAGQARGKLARDTLIALPEAPHGVAILSVPLGPAGGQIAELIPSGAHIPGLGNELQRREHGILPQ